MGILIMVEKLYLYYEIPLKSLISMERNKNIQYIRTNYGQLGVDIFQKEKKPSILTEKELKKSNNKFYKLVNKVRKFFGYVGKEDYVESDSLNRVMFKYIYNKKYGRDSDIEEVFGKKGMELFNIFKLQGYVE